MTPLAQLKAFGVQASLLDNGNLYLDRPKDLTDEVWQQAVNLAREHKAVIVSTLKGPLSKTRRAKHLTPSMLHAWRTARPWLMHRLPQLQAAGWTRAKLFRAGRLRYPFGPWGIAFLPTWTKDGVQIEIEDGGGIRFSWIEPIGRRVSQAAKPKP